MKKTTPKKRKRYSVFFENNQESVKEKIEIYRDLIKIEGLYSIGPNWTGIPISPQTLIEMALIIAIEKLRKENETDFEERYTPKEQKSKR
jgi:hypothetical protein